jgi:SAM-dependent methyltransferase
MVSEVIGLTRGSNATDRHIPWPHPSPALGDAFGPTSYSCFVAPAEELSLEPQVEEHYGTTDEQGRLDRPRGTIEFRRTMEIIGRFIPPPPALILDVGGGPGRYALELQEAGYAVQLVDALGVHVAQAQAAGVKVAAVGDARNLKLGDATVDVVLLLGPLTPRPQRSPLGRQVQTRR